VRDPILEWPEFLDGRSELHLRDFPEAEGRRHLWYTKRFCTCVKVGLYWSISRKKAYLVQLVDGVDRFDVSSKFPGRGLLHWGLTVFPFPHQKILIRTLLIPVRVLGLRLQGEKQPWQLTR